MPRGRCAGCREESFLPPFGEGMCFLCATDGPPLTTEPTGGALSEDGTCSDPTAGWVEVDEFQVDIMELFAEQQVLHQRAIAGDAYYAQRFDRTVRARVERRDGLTSYEQRELEEREERGRQKKRRASLRREALGRVHADRRERERRVHAAQVKHERRVRETTDRIRETKKRRNGAGHYADPLKLVRACEMRAAGASLRQIARETGLHKETVRSHTQWTGQSEAMVMTHKRWKAEGRPVVPPWQRPR